MKMPRRQVHVLASSAFIANHLIQLLPGIGWKGSRLDAKEHDTTVFLEADALDQVASSREARRMVELLLGRLGQLMQTFQPWHDFWLRLVSFNEQEPGGRRSATSGPIQIQVLPAGDLDRLPSVFANGQTLVCRLLQLAETHEDVAAALDLIPPGPPSWYNLYDVLKFFETNPGLLDAEWASGNKLDLHRRTANHYRHLGTPDKYPLPDNPPSIQDSRVFVLGLLRQWIEKKLAAD